MKTKPIKKTGAWLVILALMLSSFAGIGSFQEPLRKRIETYLQKMQHAYRAEKVYLHLDKPYYVSGETIWLKAYLQDVASLKPVAGNEIVYVDLIDAAGKPAERLVLNAANGQAAGNVTLPDSLPTGVYRLTAYTNWMRNFGEESFFNKKIQVWNRTDEVAADQHMAQQGGKIDLQFFPEGGDIVQGLPATIAFKAITPQGKGVPVQASLFDQEGRKILDFRSLHLGMGAFELTPEAGKKYFAKVNFKDGSTVDYLLPEALPQGYTLAIDETSDANAFELVVKTNVANPADLLLTGIAQYRLGFSQPVKWTGNEFRTKVNKDQFPTGVVRFTLALPSGDPQAERLAFVNHQDQLQLNIRTDKEMYGQREKVTMHIEAKNAESKPVATGFSLAITDDELVTPSPHAPGIESYLLLTSDLKGYVEQPGYYFDNPTPEKEQALSYLMLTQGWRRFGWQQMVAGQYPQLQFAKETDLAIRGKLQDNKGKPVAKGEVILYLKDQHQTFIVEETNENGEFAFEGFNFTDTVSLVIQGSDARGRRQNVEVAMDKRNYVPATPTSPVPGADQLLASAGKDYVSVSDKQIQSVDESQSVTLGDIVLKDIVIEDRAKIEEPFRLHNRADAVFKASELPVPSSGNILEVLQGRVAGLQIRRTGFNEFSASIRGQGQPLYLLDGVPVQPSTINSISSFDIDRIEVLKSAASAGIYGGRGGNGAIAFYTKRGGTSFEEIDEAGKKFIIIHRAGGFSKVRQFYSPKYESNSDKSQPDLRTTLYWNPMVKTDANGNAQVSFYTADRNTRYRAILEGISENGKPGRKEYTFGIDDRQVSR